MNFITHEENNKVLTLTFNNIALNALSKEFIKELNKYLLYANENSQIHVVIIKSEGHIFSVGANLKELYELTPEELKNHDPLDDWQYLASVKKPVISCVNGPTYGGGVEILLMTDFIFASPEARFSFPEVNFSLLPGGGGTQRLVKRVGLPLALHMCLTGEPITAEEAYKNGFVYKLSHLDKLYEHAYELALKLASFSTQSIQSIKKLLYQSCDLSLDDGLKEERKLFYNLLFNEDAKQKIDHFLKKKKN